MHKCCCGCGADVVTPLSPAAWTLSFDGRTVSLHPSIGSWALPCQSHYWIKNNQVVWARRWSAKEIGEARALDRLDNPRLSALPPAGAISERPIVVPSQA